MLDLLIKGGTVVDGTGAPAFQGDVGITGDRIVAVGAVDQPARQTIDASRLLVTPGFVDIHTHYDGQASWDPHLMPSSIHGVTSIAFGNCGVGFAPARPDRHDWLIELLEAVEDIPGTALSEGISWDWETFPEFMDALDRRHFAIDVGAHVPHAPLRTYVVGDKGADADYEPTAEESAEMARLVAEALELGALGFTTSRTEVHRTPDGKEIGIARAKAPELEAIAAAMAKSGKGVIQLISDAYLYEDEGRAHAEFDLIRRIAKVSGRPVSMTVQQVHHLPRRWRWMLDQIEQLRAEGLDVSAQVASRGIGGILGLQTSVNPFIYTPTWQTLVKLPLAQRVTEMRRPEIRRALLSELSLPTRDAIQALLTRNFGQMFRMNDPVDYEPAQERSLAAEAEKAGRDPADYVYDVLLEEDGRRLIYMPAINYAEGNLDAVFQMMSQPYSLYGLSDGGAHCGSICDASFTTTAIDFWSKGNRSGHSLPLEELVHGYSRRNALHVGWDDRGLVQPGFLADINIIDRDELALPPPEPVADLPAGGLRLMQKARGYRATIKSGRIILRDGELTGELPGRLVRQNRS